MIFVGQIHECHIIKEKGVDFTGFNRDDSFAAVM